MFGMRWCACALVVMAAVACGAAVTPPAVQVVANARREEVAPLTAGAGFVLTGKRLTVWRSKLLGERRSFDDQPGAVAIARDGRACATAAIAPALGLRSYRLPGLEPIQKIDACNARLDISPSGTLIACLERQADTAQPDGGNVQTLVKVFTFPDLQPVQSWGPLADSVDALSFVGAAAGRDRLAVATTLLEPPRGPDNFRTRLDVYDAQRGKVVGDFSRPGRYPYLAFVPDSDVFAWAGQAGAEAWSARSFAKVRTFSATAHTIAIALSPNGRLLATSQRERPAEDLHPGGGGNIQVFDTRSGELVGAFGSADLRAAASPSDMDLALDRAQLEVQFVFVGTATGNARSTVGDVFGGPGYVANHEHLAFADEATLVSSGRGFFALWNLSQPALRNARLNH
jgi:hypothetical protein